MKKPPAGFNEGMCGTAGSAPNNPVQRSALLCDQVVNH